MAGRVDGNAGMWAVVPVKNLTDAKQRLAPALPQAERTSLYRVMLQGVLDALAGAELLATTVVVTRDPWAMEQAEIRGMQDPRGAREPRPYRGQHPGRPACGGMWR